MVDVVAFAAECRIPDSQQELLNAFWPPLNSESLTEVDNRDIPLYPNPDQSEVVLNTTVLESSWHVPGGYLEQQEAPELEAISQSQDLSGEVETECAGDEAAGSEGYEASEAVASQQDRVSNEAQGGITPTYDDIVPSLALSDFSPVRIGRRLVGCSILQVSASGLHPDTI
jgi:hypothetical protein